MKLLTALLFTLYFFLPCAAALTPVQKKAQKASHTIATKVVLIGEGACSATAVTPYAILTASHCERPSSVVFIDGRAAQIAGVARDDNDHTVYLLSGIGFADYVEIDEKPLETGDDVFMFGNPGPFSGMFRKGYVSDRTAKVPPALAALMAAFGQDVPPPQIFYSFSGWYGDSGGGVFDESGKLRGVVSFGVPLGAKDNPADSMLVVGGIELDFSPEDLQMIRDWKPDVPQI